MRIFMNIQGGCEWINGLQCLIVLNDFYTGKKNQLVMPRIKGKQSQKSFKKR